MSDGSGLILAPTTGSYSLPNTTVLTIKLSIADASLLRERSLACAMAGNNIFAIPLNMPYQAREIVPDSTDPQVVTFTLEHDVNNVNLTLHFDEMVNGSSFFNSTVLTLLSAQGS